MELKPQERTTLDMALAIYRGVLFTLVSLAALVFLTFAGFVAFYAVTRGLPPT